MSLESERNDSHVDRRRAVALNADVVGYSRHIADDPDATVESMRLLKVIVSEAVEENSGILVDFAGDSFLAVFDDAARGLGAAIGISRNVAARNAGLAEERRMHFRMGLESGDVVVTGGQYFGDALNIASRIQAIAAPGGINVSRNVYAELDEPALRFESLGPQRLKNIPEQIVVYRLMGMGADRDVHATVDHSRPAIAVLPFVIRGDDAVLGALADALRFDLVASILRVPGVSVIDVPTRDLDASEDTAAPARWMLEGGVIAAGDDVRVYAQILDTVTMNRVWSGRWTGTSHDLFGLADQVTAEVVRALEIDLVVGEPARIYRAGTDARGMDAVYQGWYSLISGTIDGWLRANRYFEKVGDLNPDSPVGPSLSAFARWYGVLNGLSADRTKDLALARSYAEQGIALDDPTGLSHMVRAALALVEGGDLDSAFDEARMASMRRPTCDVTFGVQASIERYRGNWEKGVEAARRAIAISPVIRTWYSTVMAGCLYAGGRHNEAADLARSVIDADPGSLDAHLVLVAARKALGQHRRAAAIADLVAQRFPTLDLQRFAARQPFTDQSVMERWMTDLKDAGIAR